MPLHARIELLDGDRPQRLYFSSRYAGDAVLVEAWHGARSDVGVRPLFPLNDDGERSDFGVGLVLPGNVFELILPEGPLRGLDVGLVYARGPGEFPDQSHLHVRYTRGGDNSVPIGAHVYALEFDGAGTIDAFVH